jgi:hypothetical protein
LVFGSQRIGKWRKLRKRWMGRVLSRLRLTTLKMPRKSPRKRLRVQVDDKDRLDGKEMLAGLLIDSF